MALPAIADVRRGSPQATIVVAARASVAPLFRMVRGRRRGDRARPAGADRSARDVDAALLLPNSFRRGARRRPRRHSGALGLSHRLARHAAHARDRSRAGRHPSDRLLPAPGARARISQRSGCAALEVSAESRAAAARRVGAGGVGRTDAAGRPRAWRGVRRRETVAGGVLRRARPRARRRRPASGPDRQRGRRAGRARHRRQRSATRPSS